MDFLLLLLFVMWVSYLVRRSIARRRELRVRAEALGLARVEAIAGAWRAAD